MAQFDRPRHPPRSRNRIREDENENEEEFFPRLSSLNLYSPSMEKPDQLREWFRTANEEKTIPRCALEGRVG
jgi:hypothetical protein